MKQVVLPSLCLSLLLVGCGIEHKEKYEQQTLPVQVLTVDTMTSMVTHSYVGEVEEQSSTPLSFQMGGRITSIFVKNGQHVRQGQVLMSVDNTQTKNLLASAQSKLRQAEDGYRRVKQVYDEGGVTEVKMVEIETQLAEAQSLVKGLQKQLDDCVLYAPSDGVVNDLNVQTGQNLIPGQSVLSLVSVVALNVVFTVPEADIAKIKMGERGTATIAALNDATFNLKVVEKSLTSNRVAHTYDVKCALTNPSDELLPGLICNVQLEGQGVQGYFLPSSCIQMRQDGATIWVAKEGKAQRCLIQIGGYIRDGVLVQNGLQQGDKVIISGYQKLYNGAPIQFDDNE